MSVTQTDPPRAEAPPPAAPRRAVPRLEAGLLAAGLVAALVVYLVWETYPNYDTYYTLVWGQELYGGSLPDYGVFRTPTPHPLSTAVAWAIAPFGTASDRLLVLAGLLGYVAFLAVMYLFTKQLLGRVIALIALAVLLTRTDIQFLALRAMFDLPFYLLVFGAALLELRRPKAGWPVLALLTLAGLIRPEAWLLGGVYWLYLAKDLPRPDAAKLFALVVAAPLLWMLADLIVTGEPLYSLTSTQEVAGEFGRDRGIGNAIANLPRFSGGTDTIVTVGAGGLGLLLAVYLLRGRAALPLALGGLGLLTFLIIAAAGLSVIPRYMTIPSLLLTLCVAVALGGWTLAKDQRTRRIAIGVAVLALGLIGFRAPDLVEDFSNLNRQATFVEGQHEQLLGLLDEPGTAAAIQACKPITVPTHAAIPVLRYETGLAKEDVVASIQQDRPPTSGTHITARVFNFEPSTGRAVAAPRRTVERRWSTRAAPGFERVARSGRWGLSVRCDRDLTARP